MKIKFAFFAVLVSLLFIVSSGASLAKNNEESVLPEEEGTYSVPNHPNLKLRVHVYNPAKGGNAAKPTPLPPSLQCTLSDPDSTAVNGAAGWRLPAGSWTYRLNTAKVPDLVGGNNLADIAARSFAQWSQTKAGNTVTFTKGADTTVSRATFDQQNIISWGRTSGTALAVTYTWYYPSTGVAVETDTIFNGKFKWAWSGSDSCAYSEYYDAQDILTHELGHWVGLDDRYTSEYVHNTMYGYGSPTEVKKNTLTSGDISAVSLIY